MSLTKFAVNDLSEEHKLTRLKSDIKTKAPYQKHTTFGGEQAQQTEEVKSLKGIQNE
jgi:hypothetical protein